MPETKLLTVEGNFSALMVAGIDRFLTRATSDSILKRAKLWHRDFSSPEVYRRSVEPNRKRFRKIIGAIDERVSLVKLQYRAGPDIPIVISETDSYQVIPVRRSVLLMGILISWWGVASM